jgi:hypothetical protein
VLSGCGTVANFASMKPRVYGGLAQDEAFFKECHPPGYTGTSGKGALIYLAVFLGLVPAELCCTLVGDTLTLPITMLVDPYWPPPPPEPKPDCSNYPVQYSTNSLEEQSKRGDSDFSLPPLKPLGEP